MSKQPACFYLQKPSRRNLFLISTSFLKLLNQQIDGFHDLFYKHSQYNKCSRMMAHMLPKQSVMNKVFG